MISAGEDGTTGAPEGAAAVAEDGISGTDPVGAPPLAGTLADTAAVFGGLGALDPGESCAGRRTGLDRGRGLGDHADRIGLEVRRSGLVAAPRLPPGRAGLPRSYAFLDAMVDDLGKSGRRTDKARFLLNILSSAAD